MTLDLSAITDSLIGLVKSVWTTAPMWDEIGGSAPGPTFTPTFTGLAPDAVRQEAGPQLSLYLYHVESNNAQEALFWQSQMLQSSPGEPTRFLPLALDLFYLLHAYSELSYSEEQEAMSVALRVYHASPIVRSDPGAAVPWELTLTMEHRSYDELSRLWQATTAPLRMSVVYRAAVVFIDPDPAPPLGPETQSYAVEVTPLPLPSPAASPPSTPVAAPQLLATFRDSSYVGPAGESVPLSQSPATVAAGQSAWIIGSNLGGPAADGVFLQRPGGGTETDVTAWVVAAQSGTAKIVLALPSGVELPAVPDPGIYDVCVGHGALGSPAATRSAAVAVNIAAFVDGSAGPNLSGPAPYEVHGHGFVSGATEVLVGTSALTETATTPTAGQFSLDVAAGTFSFAPPAGPPLTVLPVRVRVNGVESDPALWVTL